MTPPDDVSTRLAEIRERVEAATEGPWRAQDYPQRLKGQGMSALEVRGVSSRAGPDRDRVQDRHVAFAGWDGGTHRDQMEANAEFVAAARSDVPYLLSLVEEVGKALAKAKVMWHVVDGELYERDDEEAARERAEHLGVEVVPVRVIPADNDRIATTLNALRDAAQEGAE